MELNKRRSYQFIMGRRVAHAHAYRAVAAALGYITACARELGSFKLRVSPNSMLFRHPLRCTRDSTLLASTTTLSIVPFPFPFVSLLVSLSLSLYLSIYLSLLLLHPLRLRYKGQIEF